MSAIHDDAPATCPEPGCGAEIDSFGCTGPHGSFPRVAAVRVFPPVATAREAEAHLLAEHGYGADELDVIEDALCLHGSTHSTLIAPADLGHVHAETGGRARFAVRRAVGATLDDLTGTDT